MSDESQLRPDEVPEKRAGGEGPPRAEQPSQWPVTAATSRGAQAPQAAVLRELHERFPDVPLVEQVTQDGIPTAWVPADRAPQVLRYLGREAAEPFAMLYDLGGVDERQRLHREGQPDAAFSVFYHLVSYKRNADVRLKVALPAEAPEVPSVAGVWPAADWYERELAEMFGVGVAGHDHLHPLLLPPWWDGHPLRKEHPSRGTEYGPFELPDALADEWQEQLRFKPEMWGLPSTEDDPTLMYLNVGPQHGATHGPFRVVLGLRDEEIVHLVPDIGYHHRGQEKMAERQSWHTYIPYTDRVDYLGGVTNNLPYVLSVEQLCGIEVPERAALIRVLLCEAYRIASHLVYYGTFAQDIGALSPVFYMFEDREILFDEVVEPITGGRMHPNWFRIGGVAEDLPRGWKQRVLDYCDYLPPRLNEYDKLVMDNRIVKARLVGISPISVDDAVAWGLTGPMLRAAGLPWDWRKQRPYSHYDWFDFDVPVGTTGDAYDRAAVHIEEMRQSLRIMRQVAEALPDEGPYKAYHPLATPPMKEPHTMHDIESLITHFLGVTWGPVVPPGEACVYTEGTKGQYSYYTISDGANTAYRVRIRTACFPHLQVLPKLCVGYEIADLVTVLGSIDFVMADVDR